MNESQLNLLAEKLQGAQDIDLATAQELASSIASLDNDIAAAAFEWSQTGVMPETPSIEGVTPRSLDSTLFPSQVFTGLAVLRREGRGALNFVIHARGRRVKSLSNVEIVSRIDGCDF